jgi:hypothetical protein
MGLVRQILTDPAVWPHVGDDFAPPREEWQPVSDSRIWYVLAIEGTRLAGLLTFVPRSTVLWEIHVVFTPGRCTRGVYIGEQVLAWMFEHSTAERIIAEIPAGNRLAVRLASRTMKQYGVNERAFMKGGILQDLVLFGLSKGEHVCRV